MQHNKRFRAAVEERTQAVPREGAVAVAQGEVPHPVPRPARVLRGAVPGEGRHSHGAGCTRSAQVLAEDLLAERGVYIYLYISVCVCAYVCVCLWLTSSSLVCSTNL